MIVPRSERARTGLRALAAATAAVVLITLLGCAPPTPRASNAVPPAATAPLEPPIVWAVLGTDESSPAGPAESFAERWPQRVLRELPLSTELVNVAATGPTPYASFRNMPMPPADGNVLDSLT